MLAEKQAAKSIGNLRGKFMGLVDQLRASEARCDDLKSQALAAAQLRAAVLSIVGDAESSSLVNDKLRAAVKAFDRAVDESS